MSVQIVFAWNEACEQELLRMGFEKKEVYIKSAPIPPDGEGSYTERQNKAGDAQIFQMDHKPFQFITTSWWGAGPE